MKSSAGNFLQCLSPHFLRKKYLFSTSISNELMSCFAIQVIPTQETVQQQVYPGYPGAGLYPAQSSMDPHQMAYAQQLQQQHWPRSQYPYPYGGNAVIPPGAAPYLANHYQTPGFHAGATQMPSFAGPQSGSYYNAPYQQRYQAMANQHVDNPQVCFLILKAFYFYVHSRFH